MCLKSQRVCQHPSEGIRALQTSPSCANGEDAATLFASLEADVLNPQTDQRTMSLKTARSYTWHPRERQEGEIGHCRALAMAPVGKWTARRMRKQTLEMMNSTNMHP